MKTKILILAALIAGSLIYMGCEGEQGPPGLPGMDGNANVIYSPWYTPNAWNGQTGDWYFNVASTAISGDVVETGVILCYMSVPDDIYPAAVRPLPAWAVGANWDFLIPDYGQIEFLCDALDMPGTANHYFRFVIIPSNIPLKSASNKSLTAEELKKMSYAEVCKKYNIPE